MFGKAIEFDCVESTNDKAKNFCLSGKITENTVFIAEKQTSGRGRSGKDWVSEKGNIFVSIALKDISLTDLKNLPFIAAVAIGRTLAKNTEKGLVNYKWPNDVLFNGKKIAGILIEPLFLQQNNKNADFVIIGFGVNIASSPKKNSFPATSLKENNILVDKDYFLQEILSEFEPCFQNPFENILSEWKEVVIKLNEQITVKTFKDKYIGEFVDIDFEGNLLLKMTDNKIKKISAGDVFF